jgi:hypothetical protein
MEIICAITTDMKITKPSILIKCDKVSSVTVESCKQVDNLILVFSSVVMNVLTFYNRRLWNVVENEMSKQKT